MENWEYQEPYKNELHEIVIDELQEDNENKKELKKY
jgi:hypothetical protein